MFVYPFFLSFILGGSIVTLATLLPEIIGAVGDLVPDLGVFIAAGAVVSLAAVAVRRFVKSAR